MLIIVFANSLTDYKPRQKHLPEIGSYIYAFLEEQDSDGQQDWYLAKIHSIFTDGSTTIKYSKGNTTEDVNLNDINWVLANGSFLILTTHQNITVLIQDKEIHTP